MIFLGYKQGAAREIFRSPTIPTFASHGEQYNAVVGPFRTLRGARFMLEHGQGNPHCRTVSEAEALGKKYADE